MTSNNDSVVRPSTARQQQWLPVVSPAFRESDFGWDTGKWCIVRHSTQIDDAWERVCTVVREDRLQLAKCSTAVTAPAHAGTHVICVYCPRSNDRDDVMRVREVLREIGFVEELGYKTDHATILGIYGTPDEWLYRG